MTRIIPRFIYHLTNQANYEAIINSGILRAQKSDCISKGVYTAELTNLFKRWRSSKDWHSNSLQERLLKHCADGEDTLIMLKIPTQSLNTDRLIIRSQNQSFREVDQIRECLNEKIKERNEALCRYTQAELDKLDKNLSEKELKILEDKIYNDFCRKYPYPDKDDIIKTMDLHIMQGAPVKERKLYQQRKEAIEYIYTEDIPTSQIEKIGEVNIDELRKTAEYDPSKPMRSIFSALLRDTPQEKGALLLNC